MSRKETSILDLPIEILELTSGYMSDSVLRSFSQVCRLFKGCTSLNRLMRTVVYGTESSVIALLNKDPRVTSYCHYCQMLGMGKFH